MHQQSQPPSLMEQLRAAGGWAILICNSLAVTWEVFLHRPSTIGERYLGPQAAAAILLIPAFAIFWPEHDASPLLVFLACYLAMCFFIRLATTIRRRAGGPQPHSYYPGESYISRLTHRFSERTVKYMIEPMLAFIISTLMMALSRPLGSYLLVATFGLVASNNLCITVNRERLLDLHDAAIEAEQQAEEFREMRGDE